MGESGALGIRDALRGYLRQHFGEDGDTSRVSVHQRMTDKIQ
jgi:hypothetical protein